MPRKSEIVIQELLDSMAEMVTEYHSDVQPSPQQAKHLIDGTAFFAGGSGLWRGREPHGPLPNHFPDHPVMLIAHNFGDLVSFEIGLHEGGEVHGSFKNLWCNLLAFLDRAGLQPQDCFFTNALMGFRCEGRSGHLSTAPEYRSQCLAFLAQQIHIVSPRATVTLGVAAAACWKATLRKNSWLESMPNVAVMHPAARARNWEATRDLWCAAQGNKIKALLSSAGPGTIDS